MAKQTIGVVYDDAGFPSIAAFTAPVTIGTTQTVKASPGRLCRIVVTTATATALTTIYDGLTAAGTPLFIVPIAAPIGTVYAVDLPALVGITVAGAGTGAITIGYS
ncbi:MAG TPA: hypothetical protein VK586_24120 [Streptosporangiaceae bacterium]|nr:hypothetical protein [Streptosporangiaceae bacterium]